MLTNCGAFAAGSLTGYEAVGVVMLKDNAGVMVNNARVLSGTTLFKGDVLQTGQGATAVLKLRSGASVTLSPGGELAMERTPDSATMNLRQGVVYLRSNGREPELVSAVGKSILMRSEGGFPAICRIAVLHQSAAVANESGYVEIHGAGAPFILPMGKRAALEAGRPQAGSQGQAGKVSNEIPAETVVHAGKTGPLNVQDVVYFNDTVATHGNGRVRIELNDGSALNVGVRSVMKITKQDPATQQTEVELTAGKLRGEVVKLPKPGAAFQVKTQTAVIGVVGTTFVVEGDKKKTRVWCIEGLVRVHNLNLAVVGEILLHAGEFTTVLLGAAPAAASVGAAGSLVAQTNVTGVTNPSGLANLGNIAHIGTIGAGTGASVGAGAAISQINSATTLLNTVAPVLNNVTTSSNNATGSSNNTSGNSSGLGGVLGDLNTALGSPDYPCGCH
jgi:hypothetical protein